MQPEKKLYELLSNCTVTFVVIRGLYIWKYYGWEKLQDAEDNLREKTKNFVESVRKKQLPMLPKGALLLNKSLLWIYGRTPPRQLATSLVLTLIYSFVSIALTATHFSALSVERRMLLQRISDESDPYLANTNMNDIDKANETRMTGDWDSPGSEYVNNDLLSRTIRSHQVDQFETFRHKLSDHPDSTALSICFLYYGTRLQPGAQKLALFLMFTSIAILDLISLNLILKLSLCIAGAEGLAKQSLYLFLMIGSGAFLYLSTFSIFGGMILGRIDCLQRLLLAVFMVIGGAIAFLMLGYLYTQLIKDIQAWWAKVPLTIFAFFLLGTILLLIFSGVSSIKTLLGELPILGRANVHSYLFSCNPIIPFLLGTIVILSLTTLHLILHAGRTFFVSTILYIVFFEDLQYAKILCNLLSLVAGLLLTIFGICPAGYVLQKFVDSFGISI